MANDKINAHESGLRGAASRWREPRPESRNKSFNVKLTPAELTAIEANSKAAGLSRNEYVIRAAINWRPD